MTFERLYVALCLTSELGRCVGRGDALHNTEAWTQALEAATKVEPRAVSLESYTTGSTRYTVVRGIHQVYPGREGPGDLDLLQEAC